MKLIISILAAVSLSAAPHARAQNFYVAPGALPGAAGTLADPASLSVVLGAAIPPGSVIWMLGGTYTGHFTSTLAGTAAAPIIITSYPGVRATISDTRNWANGGTLDVYGSNTIWYNFEITNSGTDRTIGPPSTPFRPMGINVLGPNTAVLDLVIHDTGHGVGMWQAAPGSIAYGNIIYNCGSLNTPAIREYGHGLYIQNNTGTKVVQDNIVFDNFGFGVHAYSPGNLTNITIDGNISWDNGISTAPGQRYSQILVDGSVPYRADGITVTNNMTFDSATQVQTGNPSDGNVCFGCYGGSGSSNGNLQLTGNYFAGGYPTGNISGWTHITNTGNTFYSVEGFFSLYKPALPYTWDSNAYYSAPGYGSIPLFNLNGSALTQVNWDLVTGFDSSSSATYASPADKVILRPNIYVPSRANIAVYNWSLSTTFNVNLSSILTTGQGYAIFDATNIYGTPVLSGTYPGGVITVPIVNSAHVPPVGTTTASPATPQFHALVVIGL